MNIQRLLTSILFIFSVMSPAAAEYQIKGKVKLSAEWQRQIFLSTINKIDDYYRANPSNIIQVGTINEDGTFYLNGNNLPPDQRFYRLYLIKEENTEFDACIYFEEDDHNFIHLILDNNTQVDIVVDESQVSPFGNYEVLNSASNKSMQQLSKLVVPSFHFYKIKFPSEREFSEQKLNRDLFQFADTCKNTLVSLAAMITTDMDQYYTEETKKYESFADRLSSDLTNHIYTDHYFRKIKYYQGTNTQESKLPHWAAILILLLIGSLIFTISKIRTLSKKIKTDAVIKSNKTKKAPPSLTQQEEKILAFIVDGKSNKEIASELYVELSTVKTHINKLYSKLEVKNRSEAKMAGKQLLLTNQQPKT